MDLPDPGDEDWEVLAGWLELEVAAFVSNRKNPNQFASLVWRHFFASISWFHLTDRRGLVADWLDSSNDNVVNMAVHYLGYHQRHAADRVAELLEPYVGQPVWAPRLRSIMQGAEQGSSRRFFELFLRLVDDGTLDDPIGPIAGNWPFFEMIHGLPERRPDWVGEVLGHWLRRRLALILQVTPQGAKPRWRDFFNHAEFGAEVFHKGATGTPVAFIECVLPAVLEIIDAAARTEGEPPRGDAVWSILIQSQYPDDKDVLLNALRQALGTLTKTRPELIGDVVGRLQGRETYTANYLLLCLYTAGAEHFADAAAGLLCEEPWRLHCGYLDNGLRASKELVRAIAPHCSGVNRERLEATILGFSPDYERGRGGYQRAGRASFELLSGIPPEYRSRTGQSRYEQFERKFGGHPPPSQGIQEYIVGSPIDRQGAKKMTDTQWLKAIAKYDSEARTDWRHPERGGARELADLLGEFVRGEPERFARLSLTFPAGTNTVYLARTLDGLKGTVAATDLKLDVCRRAYAVCRLHCGMSIADLLGSIEEPLPVDAREMLGWLATEHPDPEKELWSGDETKGSPFYGGGILEHGINTTRGRAAEAIRDLIFRDGGYLLQFRPTLERLVIDRSLAVRSCVASTLLAVARHDMSLALDLFERLADADDRLLATQDMDRFLYHGLNQHFSRLRPYLERMLRSKEEKVVEVGARLASVTVLSNEDAADLVDQAMSGGPSQRLGVARVAARNIARDQSQSWCESHLLLLFNDGDPAVRREAASCFRQLNGESLQRFATLIISFCDSAAFQKDSFPVLHALKGSMHRLPGITCDVCEKFLLRFGDEDGDIRTGRSVNFGMVGTLVFRTYQQHQHDEWSKRCLDLIDRMCLAGFPEVKGAFDEFER